MAESTDADTDERGWVRTDTAAIGVSPSLGGENGAQGISLDALTERKIKKKITF